MPDCRIKIIKNGPYMVSGNVPIEEKMIISQGNNYRYVNGKKLPQSEKYALCRCGHSKNMPFCDGEHIHLNFNGTETASREPYLENAVLFGGSDFVLSDYEELCAFARFCHKPEGDVWTLTDESDNPKCRDDAIEAACDCPAGRLVVWDRKTGEAIEPKYEPSIVIIQDPERQCSGPIWVRGGIPIESSDGSDYEVRNRVTLCRCGKSGNKPFCDAMHVMIGFNDSE
jgi:CDGSH-type Zn-finger protein